MDNENQQLDHFFQHVFSKPARATALLKRLVAVCDILGSKSVDSHPADRRGLESSLLRLSNHLEQNYPSDEQRIGRFFFAVSGYYLNESKLDRLLFLNQELKGSHRLLALLAHQVQTDGDLFFKSSEFIEIVPVDNHCLLVDVTHTETCVLISGIQRVVRKTCEELAAKGADFKLVRINPALPALQLLSPEDISSFLSFSPGVSKPPGARGWRAALSLSKIFNTFYRVFVAVIPGYLAWLVSVKVEQHKEEKKSRALIFEPVQVPFLFNSKVLLPEITDHFGVAIYTQIKRQFSFTLSMVIYDLIPIFDPEFSVISDLFAVYLNLLRSVDRISCISRHTLSQISQFIQIVDRRGKPLPKMDAHALAGDFSGTPPLPHRPQAEPKKVFLSVGTIEPRKNQLGALRAATHLWNAGFEFKMIFAGNKGWLNKAFIGEFQEAKRSGRDVELLQGLKESELAELYLKAHCTVFCSFSEGFGLPIVESWSFGKPCITSDLGSMKEIAESGGCVLVNPHSIESIAKGMESILNDQVLYSKLIEEIRKIPLRTWQDYSNDLYNFSMSL